MDENQIFLNKRCKWWVRYYLGLMVTLEMITRRKAFGERAVDFIVKNGVKRGS